MKQKHNSFFRILSQVTSMISILLVVILMASSGFIYLMFYYQPKQPSLSQQSIDSASTTNTIKNSQLENDFILSDGVDVVVANCTGCHSSKLVTQNRANREGWKSLIRWMQQTQDLWDLGANEDVILDYLSKHYAPENKGRRSPITNIEWYVLNE